MTMPQLPAGRAPVPATLNTEVAAVRQRLDELGRRGPLPMAPVCRVRLSVNTSLAANTDIYAQSNWAVGTNAAGANEDPDGIATLSTSPGTFSYVTIPWTGRYWVRVRGVFASPSSSGTCVAYATRNATTYTASILREPRNTTAAGGDGTVCSQARDIYLQAGDRLYWGHWSSVAITIAAESFGVPTEFSLNWIGPR